MKEFISGDHSRQNSLEDLVGGERDTLHIEVNNVEEEPEDDWEAAILQRNRTDSISVKGPRSTTFRKRQRAKGFDVKIIINDELMRTREISNNSHVSIYVVYHSLSTFRDKYQ